MARIFVTGSADGLGLMAAKKLVSQGHQVVLHARNEKRAVDAMHALQGAEKVLIADLSDIGETKRLADEVNSLGHFDAVIQNAGLYQVSNLELSKDGFPLLIAVNVLAPYLLTSLIHQPERLIYLSSGMHMQGDPTMRGLNQGKPKISYSDSKLYDLILAKAVARKWPGVYSNAVDPGWVPTKMGGPGAPDNLEKGFETQVWLAVSNDEKVKVSGRYFHHQKEDHYLKNADDTAAQEALLAFCEKATGVAFPNNG